LNDSEKKREGKSRVDAPRFAILYFAGAGAAVTRLAPPVFPCSRRRADPLMHISNEGFPAESSFDRRERPEVLLAKKAYPTRQAFDPAACQ